MNSWVNECENRMHTVVLWGGIEHLDYLGKETLSLELRLGGGCSRCSAPGASVEDLGLMWQVFFCSVAVDGPVIMLKLIMHLATVATISQLPTPMSPSPQ